MVKGFLFSSNKLQENFSEKDLASENIKSKDSTTLGVLLGSSTKATVEVVTPVKKEPGFLEFKRLNSISQSLSRRVKIP